jgi:transposase
MTGKPARKTDKEDARKIARFLQRYPEEDLPLAEVPSVAEEKFGSLVPLKGFLARERTQPVNRLCAVYARTGITDLKKSSLAKEERCEKQVDRLPEPLRDIARILECGIQLYGEQLGEIEERTGQKARSYELAPYVLPVPGAGMGIASAFLAYVGADSRFSKPPEAANCAGLTPRSLLRSKEGGWLRSTFHGLNGRMGKTESAAGVPAGGAAGVLLRSER